MRVVVLISGGKDSCYSAMQCVTAGHTLVALANLQPEGKEDELDSYMFQTVGHEAIELVAQAMGLPLYRSTTSGRSKGRGLQYQEEEGDEVEDLYHLLQRVQRSEEVEGVASGAVLSDYQRLRVENVCERLGLTSLALLWRREQGALLEDMIAGGVNAVLVKVACIGLKVNHLGLSLQEMRPHLTKLGRQYGVNVCGEGGEYETITLDCPLFTHSIIIEEREAVEVTGDELAPVAHLKLKKLRLQPKIPSVKISVPALLPPPSPPHTKYEASTKVACGKISPYETHVANVSEGARSEEGRVWKWAGFEGRGGDIRQQTSHVLTQLSDWLKECGGRPRDVALTHLFLSSMEDFPLVNSLYQPFFPSSPPARVCVQLPLASGVHVKLEALLYTPGREEEEEGGLVSMHVQSISAWAPANIGPYSQAVRGGSLVLLAGQIGLNPLTMNLEPPAGQPSLALRHTAAVLEANHTHLTSALCGTCYYTTEEAGWAARTIWAQECEKTGGCGPVVVFVRVPGLPRGACVEWSFIALTSPLHCSVSRHLKEGVGVLTCEEATSFPGDNCEAGAWLFSLYPESPRVGLCEAGEVCVREMARYLAAVGLSERKLTGVRWFLPRFSSSPPLSSDEFFVLTPDCSSVAASIFEGYFGQNCALSLLALLLPP